MDGNRRTGHGVESPAAVLLRDFVNTLDVETTADVLDTPGRLVDWLAEHALVRERTQADQDDLATAHALREGLRTAMLAHHRAADGPVLPAELEPALARLPMRVSLSGGPPALVPLGTGTTVAGLARLAAAVMDSAADGSWPRLKVCQEHTCLWAFIDTSKNRSRSWCSMSVCGNRTKTRTYRARRRTT
jgi:predicted RNA-binding Zn ribbon-like protein